ncbi:[FeFe] hydrogenase, group A [uncultured Mailhella sp.]|uniref:[FeFe] hydrogenase, group A n=1 Tax=uncultured Mailhella sp. TaxID=1981031 RepID=UPI0025CF122E|nr:[FeFe] hydrogenase, group A [uncultured Mailhella sp.]
MNASINGKEYSFEPGETILQVARRNGIFIPTLCHFQPLDHKPGTCRVCLAEVTDKNGHTEMMTTCNTPMEEGMRVNTRSMRVRDMQRLQVELIFADHDQDCGACARHGNCELQDLAEYVGLATNRFAPRMPSVRPHDDTMRGMVRDMTKCVRCLRCVEVCRKVQGVAALTVDGTGVGAHIGVGMAPSQNTSACIQCGQCTLVCPTGALSERDENDAVLDYIANPEITTVFSFAPSVRVVLGEEFGLAPGENVQGRIVAALRRLGADIVIDTDFAADVVIMEEGSELLSRIKNGGKLPLFTSCCPAWVNFAEKHCPDVLPYVSTTRSPQAVAGSLVKSYLAEKMGIPSRRIRTISLMPCTAKKDEAARPQLHVNGTPDTDVVLTVRELSRLFRRNGINLAEMEPEEFDNPYMSDSTGAAVIFGTTGGVMEAAVRTVYAVLNHKELPGVDVVPVRGEEGMREAEVNLGEGNGVIKVAVVHGLANAKKLAEQAVAGTSPYTFIEVMACPGGCVDGGGTCRVKKDYHPHAHERREGLFAIDHNMPRRQSHNNPQIIRLYEDFLGEPNSHKAHELLHTHYTDRSKVQTESIAATKKKLTLTDHSV